MERERKREVVARQTNSFACNHTSYLDLFIFYPYQNKDRNHSRKKKKKKKEKHSNRTREYCTSNQLVG